MHLDEVAHDGVHARPVVHDHHGCAAKWLLHADDGQRLELPAELLGTLPAHDDAENARPHDQAVHRLRRDQVVDQVGLPAEAGVVERPAAEADEVAVVRVRAVDRAEPLVGVQVDEILGHHADHRPGPALAT